MLLLSLSGSRILSWVGFWMGRYGDFVVARGYDWMLRLIFVGGKVWIGDISAHLGDINAVKTKPEFTKLTDFPVDIANVKFHRNSSTMAFTAEVYDDGGLEEAKRRKENEEKRFDSAVVYGVFLR